MRKLLLLALTGLVLAGCRAGAAEPTVGPQPTNAQTAVTGTSVEAAQHVGQRGTVCGTVADTSYATSSRGKPTFLNFDKPYPNHPFVVVIWDSDRGRFPKDPEKFYKGKTICATGLVERYQGKPEIVATSSTQLTLR